MLLDPDIGLVSADAHDAVLVDRVVNGDARAFGALFARHERRLRSVIRTITRHATDTDDVLQECAVTVWRNLHALEDPAKVGPWMARIASREALRWVLTRRQEQEVSDDDAIVDGPDHRAEHLDTRRRVERALLALPETQRQCWVLREVGGYSYREISERAGLPESTVRGALAAARKNLSQAMHDLRPETQIEPADAVRLPRASVEPSAGHAVAPTSRVGSSNRRPHAAVRVHVDPSGVPVGLAGVQQLDLPAALRDAASRSEPGRGSHRAR